MRWFVVVFAACSLVAVVYCADDTIAWCYHDPSCNDITWPDIATDFCNGSRQSPIDIVTSAVTVNDSLNDFVFTNFGNTTILDNIINTGKTVKVNFKNGVKISGGGLPESYDSLQFHLHWGNGSGVPGAEHTVDGVRPPMELHIVSIKSRFNGSTDLAINDSMGVAALGFFIEVWPNTMGQPASWKTLTNYLQNITLADQTVDIKAELSLDDLLSEVDVTQYYRYLGSLTTPACYEAVVWTVFKESIKVSEDLIDMFSTMLRIGNDTSSDIMVNVFRNIQPAQSVTTRRSESDDDDSSASSTCISLGLLALSLLLGQVTNQF